MTIPAYVQPTPDFQAGYILQPEDWNNNINGISAYFNTVVQPAINALQSAAAPNVGAQSFFNARLTASTGVPYPNTNLTGV
ncbi:MAG: hypothetical protein K2X29_11200, partial [Candidatus Obscuribacterales bacterium]|nr:hypothetical protein [Candidatus Obscuribacterales bacterium]